MWRTTSSACRRRWRPRGSRRRWASAWLAACSLAVGAGGCGSGDEEAAPGPRLPAATAEQLAGLADGVADALAAGDACAARERADRLAQATVAAINAGDVPPALQEPALAEAQALAAAIACAPAPASTPDDEPDEEAEEEADDERPGRGKGRDKQEDRKHDDKGGKDEEEDEDDEDEAAPTETAVETQPETETQPGDDG